MLQSIALQCRVAAAARYASRYYYRCAQANFYQHNILCRHFSESLEQNDNTKQYKKKGDEFYKLALEALQKAASAKYSHEEQLLREQFEAMERQREKTSQRRNRSNKPTSKDPRLQRLNVIDAMDDQTNVKDRAAGVAVVRTIVKQTRQSSQPLRVKVDKWDSQTADGDAHSSDDKCTVEDKLDEHYYQNEALKYLEEAALKYGHPLALVRLGNEALERAKQSSDEPLINIERCTEWIDESQIGLSKILMQASKAIDHDEENNISLAQLLYESAGKNGSAEAWYNLGHLLWDRSDDEDATKVKAMEAFNKAADLGDLDAMYFVGAQYLSQEQDEAGYELVQRAAQGNHGPALHHLALLSLQDGNNDEFRKLLTKAAEAGNPDSLFLQGHCLYHGEDGYEVDAKAALKSFLVAAEDFQHVDAMVSAGAMLHQGVIGSNGSFIIKRDQRRAFELYQQAGELGSMEGWRNVVACYATGEGVKQDMDMAKHIAKTMLKDI